MNIIIMNNRASFLVSFWSVLISRLQEEGHQVTCLVPAGDSEAEAIRRYYDYMIRYENLFFDPELQDVTMTILCAL